MIVMLGWREVLETILPAHGVRRLLILNHDSFRHRGGEDVLRGLDLGLVIQGQYRRVKRLDDAIHPTAAVLVLDAAADGERTIAVRCAMAVGSVCPISLGG